MPVDRGDGRPVAAGAGDVRAAVAAALRDELAVYRTNGVPHPPALDAWLVGVEADAELVLPGRYVPGARPGWVRLAGDRAVPADEPKYGLIDMLGI